ncbi:unnamed protein product [Rotaria sp. Silwood2]|nr:unnamed protein product [Rotaria sp. Silwood2]CAF4056794.1 unnamed protein product [Rotaria sp. Silwood2]
MSDSKEHTDDIQQRNLIKRKALDDEEIISEEEDEQEKEDDEEVRFNKTLLFEMDSVEMENYLKERYGSKIRAIDGDEDEITQQSLFPNVKSPNL